MSSLDRIRFRLQLLQDRDFLKINKIHISALNGKILGRAVFSRLTEKTPHHLLLDWKGLDLSLLKGILPVDVLSHAAGSMDVSFAAFERAALHGSLSAQFAPKPARPQDQDKAALAGDVLLTFRGNIQFKKAQLQSEGNSLRGELNIERERLSGSINGRINHLRGILISLSPFDDSLRSLAEKKIDGEMLIAVKISGTMAKPVLLARVEPGRHPEPYALATGIRRVIFI